MTTTLVPLGYKCPATLNLGVNMCLCSFSVLQTSYTHTAERDREGGILSTKSPRHFEPDGASRRTNQEMEETCCVRIVFCDTHATDLTQQTIIPYFWILFSTLLHSHLRQESRPTDLCTNARSTLIHCYDPSVHCIFIPLRLFSSFFCRHLTVN